MLNTTKSEELYKVALDLMPGGVNSPVRAFGAVGRNPLFIDHAKGSYVYDVDGNKFIDYVCSWGPGILGHSHPEVLEEVVKACFDGLTSGAPTGKENELENSELPQARETPSGKERIQNCDFSRCRLNVRLNAHIQPLLRGYKYRFFPSLRAVLWLERKKFRICFWRDLRMVSDVCDFPRS